MNTTELFTDTSQLHKTLKGLEGIRTHSDLIRPMVRGLDELVEAGGLSLTGRKWFANGVLVAEEVDYEEGNKTFKCIRYGSWFCLAMALKVTTRETRKALLTSLTKHPIFD